MSSSSSFCLGAIPTREEGALTQQHFHRCVVARLNFSHGDHAGHGATLERIRQAARNKMRNVAIMLDTKGPEIRSGFFANDVKKIDLVKGETLILTTVRLFS